MSEMKEFRLCVPADLTRRFKGLSIDAGKLYALCEQLSFLYSLQLFDVDGTVSAWIDREVAVQHCPIRVVCKCPPGVMIRPDVKISLQTFWMWLFIVLEGTTSAVFSLYSIYTGWPNKNRKF